MSTLLRFTWSDALKTGVPLIDVQHKELIQTFNDLADAIELGTGSSAIKKLLSYLKYYAEWHFEREERCADACRCPFAQTNKRAHERFVEIFGHLYDEYRQSDGSEAVARKAHGQLAEWIMNHVLKIDMEIGKSHRQMQSKSSSSKIGVNG
ncbi:MAG: hemerythrin family protein [Ardenticatenales bacterium]|nr:hemerythrin family protein [Ardenticatenales bacterium]